MATQTELRQQITNTIIEALESGVTPPWRKPWANDPNALGLATSLSTGQPYRGINQLLLQVAALRKGYQAKWFGTYQQIKFNGGFVRAGEKATKVVLWKPVTRERTDLTGKVVDDTFLVLREYSVFSVEQTTGLNQFRIGYSQGARSLIENFEAADRLIAATGVIVRHGGNRAYYSPEEDTIQMPLRHQFESSESYYHTLMHEAIHWSEMRIGFDRSKEHMAYGLGELIADLGSSFVLSELGLPSSGNLENVSAYIGSWLKAMRGDTKFIFRAASYASKAADFLLSHIRVTSEDEVRGEDVAIVV